MKHTCLWVVFLIPIIVTLILAVEVSAQLRDEAELKEITRGRAFGTAPAATPFSLIDLSRVRWSRSYSASFYSGGANSFSMGQLNNTMFYDISSKLSLALNFGLAHNLGGIWGDGTHDAVFLPGFNLDFHPSEKFRMSVSFQRYQGFGNYSSPQNDFWWGRRSPF